MPLSVEEAIKTAIEFETKIRDVYRDAIEQATDETGKKIFSLLAKEEQGHLDYLNYRLDELKNTGEITAEKLQSAVPSRKKIESQAGDLKKVLEPTTNDIEVRLLSKAVEVEQQTSDFYHRMVNELDGAGQKMFSRFLEIEEGHIALVQAELDYLNGTGFFFGMEEFNLEMD